MMSETYLDCPACQKRLRVAVAHLGMVVGCPHCHVPIKTPPLATVLADPVPSSYRSLAAVPGVAVSEPIRFKCPTCNGPLTVPAALVGQKMECPHCTQRLEVPAPPRPPRPVPTNKTVLGQIDGPPSLPLQIPNQTGNPDTRERRRMKRAAEYRDAIADVEHRRRDIRNGATGIAGGLGFLVGGAVWAAIAEAVPRNGAIIGFVVAFVVGVGIGGLVRLVAEAMLPPFPRDVGRFHCPECQGSVTREMTTCPHCRYRAAPMPPPLPRDR